jgi:ribosomal protein S19E (S16A)
MGREDEYFWKTAKERENLPKENENEWFFRQFS